MTTPHVLRMYQPLAMIMIIKFFTSWGMIEFISVVKLTVKTMKHFFSISVDILVFLQFYKVLE